MADAPNRSVDELPMQKEVPEGTVKEWEVLALDGNEESQLKLGEHLVKLADSDVKREENGEKGVYWLIQASKTGNAEATKLLQKCLKTKTGVSAKNKEDIEWCVETSTFEKKVRSASKGLFKSLSGAHKEVMSLDEYITAVKKMTGGDVVEEKLLIAAGKKIGDNISESDLAKMLSKKIQGKITLTASERESMSEEYKSAGIVQKVLKHPKATVMVLFDEGLEMVSKEGMSWVTSVIPTDQIYLLGIFFLYSLISLKLLFQVIPLVIFYITLAAMLVATLQMFYKKKKSKDAAAMASILKNYDVGVDVDETKSQYTWNTLTPYLLYFSCLPFLVLSFSLANKLFIPCSEICVLSAIMAGICFSALSDTHDLVTLCALVCNILSALPTFFHHFPDIPVVTTILHVVTEPLFSLEVGYGFQLNLGIPSLSHVIIGVFFVFMAAQKSWQGTYRVLLPHLICFFWWNIMTSFFPFTTWIGLGRSAVVYLLFPLLIPLIVFGMVFLFLYCFFYLFQSHMFGKLAITLMLVAIPVALTQTKALFGKNMTKKQKSIKKVVMVIFGVLALIPLAFIRLPSFKKVGKFELPFDQFNTLCGGSDENRVEKEIRCSHLLGQKVTWNGTFESATVAKIENSVKPMFSKLPEFLTDQLRCLYGETFGDCEADEQSEDEKTICRLFKSVGKDCHLKIHDTYSFNVVVKIPEFDGQFTLEAGDSFRPTIAALKQGDEVEITANFAGGLGSKNPTMKLKNIRCTNRDLGVMVMEEEEDDEVLIMNAVNDAVAVAFHFFWYPLVEYTSTTLE